ncbi:MAG: hypothetical protein IH840_09835 [Candidatus Heimdallarchaeota archaeon]|nr:hypothetical protein [Candidatus Heimdallarchaeota archaeon]
MRKGILRHFLQGAEEFDIFDKQKRGTNEGDRSGICLTGSKWGTVSSTILGLTEDSTEAFYWHAPGPPADTPYDDYSEMLRELLKAF